MVGRSNSNAVSTTALPESTTAMFDNDPALERYSKVATSIRLMKTEMGAGFSIGGGKDSKWGERPIIVKKVFAGKLR